LAGRKLKKFNKCINWLAKSEKASYLCIVCIILFAAYILTPQQSLQVFDLEIGDRVWEDVRSNVGFKVIDEEITHQRRQAAIDSVLPVYDFDSRLHQRLSQLLTESMNNWRRIMRERRMKSMVSIMPELFEYSDVNNQLSPKPFEHINDLDNDYHSFTDNTGLNISLETFRLLREQNFSFNIEDAVETIISDVTSYVIVGNRDLLLEIAPNGFIRRDTYSDEERVIYNLDTVISLDVAYREADNLAAGLFSKNQLIQDIVAELSRALIRPNLKYNIQATENLRQRASESVRPVYLQFAAGEIIIAAGETVTTDVKLRLDLLSDAAQTTRFGFVYIGHIMLLLILFLIVRLNITKYYKNMNPGRRVLLFLIFLTYILVIKGMSYLAALIPDYFNNSPYNEPFAYYFAVPFAFGCMLIALLVNTRLAIIFSFVFGIIASVLTNNSFLIGLFATFSGYAAIFAVSKYKHRTMILQGGIVISIANVIFILVVNFLDGRSDFLVFAYTVLMGIAGGLLVTMIIMIILPVFEWLFRIPTDLRLLELSNFNEPLLRRQAMDAPGTHHHSLMVADLAEAAAEAVNANSLLAKVAAYYHDIGKIMQPQYFIENIRGKNPHEKLTPNMSVMIIRKHVKDGVELARQAGLGKDIVDIIAQHHGNSVISFFHSKASETSRGIDTAAVKEENFRYSGPRPGTREAAIVLIADAVEAAARSMKSPSPSSLKLMVQKITSAKFQDHQFDECDLTFRELTQISDTLYQRLLRNNHTRIEYPGFNFNTPAVSDEFPDAERKRPGTGEA
jgi:cyclic-di-AMP phosphodiesterase PgpH